MLSATDTYRIKGLKKLTSLKEKVRPELFSNNNSSHTALHQEFTRIICEHQFADSDYSEIPVLKENNYEEWLNHFNTKTILQFLTFVLWTDSSSGFFFLSKIRDNSLFLILERLEKITNDI